MSKSKRGRVANVNSNAGFSHSPKALPLSRSYFPSQLEMFDLPSIEDRRTFHPEGPNRPARSLSSSRHRLRVPKTPSRYQYSLKKSYVPHEIGFVDPERVLVCVRRRQRRQVMHAMKKAGKRGQRRPRRSYYSSVSCRS